MKRNEVFYTEGSDNLKRTRLWLCNYSLPRAKRRLESAREALETETEEQKAQEIESYKNRLSVFSNSASQMGDERTLGAISMTSDGNAVVTGSWSGTVKLWRLPDCDETAVLKVCNLIFLVWLIIIGPCRTCYRRRLSSSS